MSLDSDKNAPDAPDVELHIIVTPKGVQATQLVSNGDNDTDDVVVLKAFGAIMGEIQTFRRRVNRILAEDSIG